MNDIQRKTKIHRKDQWHDIFTQKKKKKKKKRKEEEIPKKREKKSRSDAAQ